MTPVHVHSTMLDPLTLRSAAAEAAERSRQLQALAARAVAVAGPARASLNETRVEARATRRRSAATRRAVSRSLLTPPVGAGVRDEAVELHRRYARTRHPALRQRLAELHAPLARHHARRFAHRGEHLGDLQQVASMALLHAIDRFDPDRGQPFAAFASLTIAGELKRHFRDKRWGLRVPRSLQERYLRARDANQRLRAELGHSPTPAEVAAELDETEEAVIEALAAGSAFSVGSIDVPAATEMASPVDAFDAAVDRVTFAQLVATLRGRDRELVELRFVHGRSQRDIGVALGISQMHVSRELSRILNRLRAELTDRS